MARIVKFRFATFIPHDWVLAYAYPIGDDSCSVFYKGDNREASPTGTYRTAQEIWVDFDRRTVTPYKNTGVSHRKVECSNGQNSTNEGQISNSCLEYKWESWGASYVKFRLVCACGNPLEPSAPGIDYVLDVKVWSNGGVEVTGEHDGFPAYEMYKQVDNGTWQQLFLHDPRETGEYLDDLVPPMDHKIYVDN
ncbi:DUF3238 domain-containing protein [Brevibacillus formosus]|uniref:DUF3238 domain-containing protein n=1 Tax=Brevibacillus formosus TaxID=54913 RepID=UPI003F1CD9DF